MENSFPDSWKIYPLEECMDLIIDYRGKTPQKTSYGIPLVTAKVVKNGRIETEGKQEYIAVDEFDTWMRRGLPKPGDVVITTEAPLGEVAQLDNRKVALAQRLITLRGKKNFLDNTFLKYLFQSDFIQNQLKARSTGTTVLGIKQSELRKIFLPIPPFSEQVLIGNILGSLDKKIDTNHNMNQTIEEIARTIFKSWFVDFDPVRAKSEGRDTGLPTEFSDLFPDSFEESAMGEIPCGWKTGKLAEIGDNIRQIINPQNFSTMLPYIGLEHMPQRSISITEWSSSENVNSSKYKFSRGDILFGKLRPYFHKVGIAPTDGVCSTDILVFQPLKRFQHAYLLAILSSIEFINFTVSGSNGTRMPRTNWSDMKNYNIVIPSNPILEKYNCLLQPFFELIIGNIYEEKNLSDIRDNLLPKLVTGELN